MTNIKNRNSVKVVGVALALLLASSALSSVAMAQKTDTVNREEAAQLLLEANRIEIKAKSLLARAEEQGNVEATAELETVISLTIEVKVVIENGDLEKAKAILAEAKEHLEKAQRMLAGAVKKVREEVKEDVNALMRIVEEFQNAANRLIAIAEEQGNAEAEAELEVVIKLIAEVKVAIEADNYEDAKTKLREASEHLAKAKSMLKPDETRPVKPSDPVIIDRPGPVVTEDIFRLEFDIDGNGYAVVKKQNTVGALYESEISMHGVVSADREPRIHFVVNEVVITANAFASLTTDGRMITLTNVEDWDGKARHRGVFFITGGLVEDEEGNTYRVSLRGKLVDVSEQGLIYKIDGRVHHTESENTDQRHLFANLHYLAIAQAVA